MFGNRILLVYITLFVIMINAVSMGPIDEEDGPSEYEDSEMESSEEMSETTTIPDVVTDNLLFSDVTTLPMDKDIKNE